MVRNAKTNARAFVPCFVHARADAIVTVIATAPTTALVMEMVMVMVMVIVTAIVININGSIPIATIGAATANAAAAMRVNSGPIACRTETVRRMAREKAVQAR